MKFPEFLSKPVSTELKVGDTAYIRDTSYATRVTQTSIFRADTNDIWQKPMTILATGCVLPTEGHKPSEPNDTIVSSKSGVIVFTKLRYLQTTEPK